MSADDPVFRSEYSTIIMKDRDLRKKIYIEIKTCTNYYKNSKKRSKTFYIEDKAFKQY